MRITTLLLSLLMTVLTACSATPPETTAIAEPATIQLSATLVTPTDITLEWKTEDADAAGHIVEFATERQGVYTTLRFLPPHRKAYTHPDLMPMTPFYYRLRPYYGPATPAVEITLPEGAFDKETQEADHSWLTPVTRSRRPAAKYSLRTNNAAAAPTDLSSTIMHANGIKFTWTDNASDEDGYLLEAKPAGSPGFQVVRVVDPDVDSVGLITTPDEKRAAYRVRAFYYGQPSNIAYQTTGDGSK